MVRAGEPGWQGRSLCDPAVRAEFVDDPLDEGKVSLARRLILAMASGHAPVTPRLEVTSPAVTCTLIQAWIAAETAWGKC